MRNDKNIKSSSVKQSYENFWKKANLFIFVAILLTGFGFATVVNENGVHQAPTLNNITYVFSVSELQSAISPNKEVRISRGNYALTNTLNLTSNLKLVIEEGATLYYNSGATPIIIKDQQSDNKSYMFYGNNLVNLTIINNGAIRPELSFNPTEIDEISWINNGTNIEISGGEISHVFGGWNVFNSRDVIVKDIYSPDTNSVRGQMTGHECNNGVYINNIRGRGQEAVDLNAYNQNVVISDIVLKQYNSSDDEILDINDGSNILINNVVGINAKQVATIGGSGVRFGECESFAGNNITSYNLVCKNCTSDPQITSNDVIVNYFGNGRQKFISTLFNEMFHINQKGNGTALYVNMEGKQLSNTYGLWVYSNTAQTGAELVKITQDNSGSNKQALVINNDGSGVGFTLDNNGNGVALNIDNIGTAPDLRLAPNVTSKTCNSGNAGGMYYDNSTFKHYGCNSTTWNALY